MERIVLLLTLFFFQFHLSLNAQSNLSDAKDWQKELKNFYTNPETTPLNQKELKQFDGISFFPLSEYYKVKATFKKMEFQKKFLMPTSGKKKVTYKKYGILTFRLNGKQHELFVYEQIKEMAFGNQEPVLFLPFTDETNGKTSYSGGRYMDIKVPENNEVILDFNKAYNPYCAYASGYSCPIVPEENALKTRVEAGVKMAN